MAGQKGAKPVRTGSAVQDKSGSAHAHVQSGQTDVERTRTHGPPSGTSRYASLSSEVHWNFEDASRSNSASDTLAQSAKTWC